MAVIVFKTSAGSEFRLEFNTETDKRGADLSLYAGGSDSKNGSSAYEGDKGWIILQAVPIMQTQWGESGYTTSLTGRDHHVEKTEKINEVIEGLVSKADEKDNKKTSEVLQWVRKYLLDYYLKTTSVNARFQVDAYARSREIKALGIVVDTKTARIDMYFNFHLMKLIAPEELTLLNSFFDDAIAKGETVEKSFA